MYGGFSGVLRKEKGPIADLPFQWVAGRVSEVTDDAITLEPNFEKMRWQGPETNDPRGRGASACGIPAVGVAVPYSDRSRMNRSRG